MKRFLPLSFLFLIHLANSTAQSESPELATGLKEVHDLFNASSIKEVSCYRIPALVTATNGDLVAAIDERVPSCQDLRGSRDINIVIRRSQDHGKTWTEIQHIIDFPEGKSASDPSMIVDHVTGEIFLFYNYMDLDPGKNHIPGKCCLFLTHCVGERRHRAAVRKRLLFGKPLCEFFPGLAERRKGCYSDLSKVS